MRTLRLRRNRPPCRWGWVTAATISLALPLLTGATTARAQTPPPPPPGQETTTTAPLAPPQAFVVVDADTGAVIAGLSDHVRRPVASTAKIVTALVARRHLTDPSPVRISPLAESMPARKLNLKAGQTWRAGDLLRAMLLCSCNDAAMALAEEAGGSIGGFGVLARREAGELGMTDEPVLQDPAGLDDEFSVRGGNRMSAHDLAVAARALLADPELAAIVTQPNHRFRGGDGQIHQVLNHNRLLGTYPGAVGVKTGYTRRAGSSLVGAARRDGRTMVVVLLDSPNIYVQAAQLLDLGFATPISAERRLPRLTPADEPDPPTTAAPTTVSPSTESSAAGATTGPPRRPSTATAGVTEPGSPRSGVVVIVVVAVAGAVVASVVALRRGQVLRRRRTRGPGR